jgi:hypothetical protein
MRTGKAFKIIQPAIILSSLFLAGYFIFDHITLRAFWGDEADIANNLALPFSQLWHRAIVDGNPLTYTYILKVWSNIFGDSEIALRGFSAIFGLLLVFLIYKTADKFIEDKRVGHVAAFLASTNYFLIWFATQTKVYIFAAFLGSLSYYYFMKVAHKPGKNDHIIYCIITSVCAYTHPWLILVFLSQALNLFLFRKDIHEPLKILLAQLFTLLLVSPSLLITLYQGNIGVSAWNGTAPLWAIFESFKYLCFGSNAIYLCFFIVAALYVLLAKNNLYAIINKNELMMLKMLLVYLFFPLVSALFFSQFISAYSIGRYEMIVLPAFLLISAIWFSKIKNNYLLVIMVVLLALFTYKEVSADRNMVSQYNANDRTISRVLLEMIHDGDTMIATDISYPTFNYYLGHLNREIKKKFTLLIYPKELSEHPCWEDLKRMSANKGSYEKEAEDLAKKLFRERKNRNNSIWILYNIDNPFNAGLREKFKKRFNSEEILDLPIQREPSWVDVIIKFN